MDISVVIPVWNREHFILRAIKSVVAQTYRVQEIIVVDDGSTDNTLSIVSEYARAISTPEIRVVSIPHSGMPGKVRNYGIAHARGDWIALLDSDDEWLPQKLELQVHALREKGGRWCHTREIWMKHNTEVSQKSQTHKKQGFIFDDALKKCIVGPSTVLIHNTIFNKCGMFREDIEIAEDYELWLRVCSHYSIVYLDTPLIIKYAGHEQLSSKYDYIEHFRIVALQSLIENQYFEDNDMMYKAKTMLSEKQAIWERGAQKRCIEVPHT